MTEKEQKFINWEVPQKWLSQHEAEIKKCGKTIASVIGLVAICIAAYWVGSLEKGDTEVYEPRANSPEQAMAQSSPITIEDQARIITDPQRPDIDESATSPSCNYGCTASYIKSAPLSYDLRKKYHNYYCEPNESDDYSDGETTINCTFRGGEITLDGRQYIAYSESGKIMVEEVAASGESAVPQCTYTYPAGFVYKHITDSCRDLGMSPEQATSQKIVKKTNYQAVVEGSVVDQVLATLAPRGPSFEASIIWENNSSEEDPNFYWTLRED